MNATVRTRPGLFDLVGEVDSIFDQLMRPAVTTAQTTAASLAPAVDIRETESAYEVVMDLPGVSRDSLDITIEENMLTIKASRASANSAPSSTQKDSTEAVRVIRAERRHGDYLRTLQVADDVLQDGVLASLTDGVLHLTLPKAARVEPRKIDVSVG